MQECIFCALLELGDVIFPQFPVSDLAPAKKTARKQAVKKRSPLPPARAERKEVHALVATVLEQKEFRQRLKALGSGQEMVLDHVTPEARAFALALVLAHLAETQPGKRMWVLCPDVRTQDQLHSELLVWQCPTLYFPRHSAPALDVLPDPDALAERVSILSRWREHGPDCPSALLICADSLEETVPAAKEIENQRRTLEVGGKVDVEAFLEELDAAGYERVPVVMERGQYARRGGIVDFFSWQAEEPLRLEFFDDEIESIRAFDIHHQASIRRMERAGVILQISESAAEDGRVSDYLQPEDLVLVIGDELAPRCDARIVAGAAPGDDLEDFSTAIHENPLGVFDASDFVLHEARRKQFQLQLKEWQGQRWRTVIFFHNEAEKERFAELASTLTVKAPEALLGLLYRGFTIPSAKLAVLTGAEIFGRHQYTRRVRGSKLDDPETLRKARDVLRELRDGDLVVHSDHGIARYGGVSTRISPGGRREEVLVLHYAEEAKFFVPVAQAHMVTRYVGVGGKAPALSKLGGASWQKTRKSAEKSVEEFAAKMLTISAERQSVTGFAFPPDSKWQMEFENSFLYRETPDQLRCVEDIKQDMESEKPMDRLLCADVGFGKTEVAIRAAFKAVMGGKQVAILVPTTVLARQHWSNIRERMSEFPVTVEMLCRLTPKKNEKKIVEGIREGQVDIVVGTHRVISKDVRFKDLGLVVIDEEQRFGVKHKERFKELFRFVDVLTLSATPIPRTLYLALMGMRDMSTIETPPPNKQAVQTLICPYDERVIKQAVDAELDRGGQIFFLHNRVMTIEKMAQRIRELCPRAKVIIGHGQMDEELLEDVMHTFVDGRADVLVCTTIIESGVDIPNANTIIIDRADRFGLADLYQLRGRVGRGGQQAHAYLLLPRDAVTAGDARKRVNAIKQYAGLGSGFKIALRDLEIRGAGNLLGTEQSGHIAAVGFDMYCQMLKQAVNKMQGRRVARPIEVALRADFLVQSEALMVQAAQGATPAFLPNAFIEDTRLRITAYRQLGEVMTRKELDELESQWRDQFGDKLPHAVQNLLTCAAIRLAASHAGITDVEIKERKLMLTRNGQLVMIQGKFPRLTERQGHKQLQEALMMLRSL
ncbi:transcription-repair coupling factor (superfamily II helicase) [Prosthecobacter debontii]|uniref:Transcription-repair-coupling factor n=1 Tax=Prosthecobacter debontii TaxID=48467 RepID=A0A1T4WJA3_9BACT|nr:transcription-repair coupling factor (superfamily II helicase) [Prosthecobacter debontii]